MILLALGVSALCGTVGGALIACIGAMRYKTYIAILTIVGLAAGTASGKLIRLSGKKSDLFGKIIGTVAGITAIYFYWAAIIHVGAEVFFLRALMPDIMVLYLLSRGDIFVLLELVLITVFTFGITVVICTDFKKEDHLTPEEKRITEEFTRRFY